MQRETSALTVSGSDVAGCVRSVRLTCAEELNGFPPERSSCPNNRHYEPLARVDTYVRGKHELRIFPPAHNFDSHFKDIRINHNELVNFQSSFLLDAVAAITRDHGA